LLNLVVLADVIDIVVNDEGMIQHWQVDGKNYNHQQQTKHPCTPLIVLSRALCGNGRFVTLLPGRRSRLA
jgi:hypothetical protein